MDIQIRRASEKDLDRLNLLLAQVCLVHHEGRPDLFKIGRKYTTEELVEILKDDTRPVFAAADSHDNLVGYAFCIAQQHIDDHILTDIRTLYIDDLCVDETLRGQHIGRKLYEYVKEYARANGFYNLTLNVWSLNESALRFYEACGLKPQKIGMETILKDKRS